MNEIVSSKLCKGCWRNLPTTEFWRDASRADGLKTWCKQCCKAYHDPYYRNVYYPARRQELINAAIAGRRNRRLRISQQQVPIDRNAYSHQAKGQADEVISFRHILTSGKDVNGEVEVTVGISQSGNFGIEIQESGKLHRYRVIPAEVFMSLVARGFDKSISPYMALEIGNYWMAVASTTNQITLRVWWVSDWAAHLAGGTKEDDSNSHLIKLTIAT